MDIESDDTDASTPTKPAAKPRLTTETEPKTLGCKTEDPVAVPLSKFEPMPRRQKRLNLVI